MSAQAQHWPVSIGEAARRAGVSARMVRHYEAQGLLPPMHRTDGGYRQYAESDVHALRFIRRARDLGFSLDKVRELLDLSGQQQRDCATVDVLASEHLAEIDRKVADLNALRQELSALITSCQGGTMAECRILEALAPCA